MTAHMFQWITLGLCVFFVLLRAPEAIRGTGRTVFIALVLLSVAVAMSLPAIYPAVDSVFGGQNIAHLLGRFSLYSIVLLLGTRTAAAFRAQRARWLIAGPIGIAAFCAALILTATFFILSELPTSSTGLLAYGDQQTVQWYADIGRFYPGYVATCLIAPSIRGVLDPTGKPLHRVASALLAVGYVLIATFAVLRWAVGPALGVWEVFLPFSAIVLVVTGLTVVWFARRRTEAAERGNPLA